MTKHMKRDRKGRFKRPSLLRRWKNILIILAMLIALLLVAITVAVSREQHFNNGSACVQDTSALPFYAELLKPYDGMLETSYNRGPLINKANARYAYDRAPYCASVASYLLDMWNVRYPFERTARSRAFVNDYSIKAWDVVTGKAQLPRECFAIYLRKGGGHIDFVIKRIGRDSLQLFGFNTSPDRASGSSDWNGKYSGSKTRNLRELANPLHPYKITHFTHIIR